MLKTKFKFLVSILLISIILSTTCFATTETSATEATPDSEATAISAEENTITTTNTTNTTTNENTSTNDTSTEATTSLTEESNWIEHDLFVSGENITVNQIVDGNAFIIGDKVTISGEIGGDLFVMANELTISSENQGGYVYSNIFALADKLTIDGIVYDVYAMCNNFTLASNGYIYRDIKLNASEVNLEGFIRRDAYITASTLNFKYNPESPLIVNSDVNASVESVNFIPTSENTSESDVKVVGQNFKYSSNSQLNEEEISKYVTGETNYLGSNISTISSPDLISGYITTFIAIVVLTMIVMLILHKVTPKFVENSDIILTKKTLPVIGSGLLGVVVAPVAMIILLLILVGLPACISLIFGYGFLISISTPVLAIALGNILCRKMKASKKFDKIILPSLLAGIIFIIGELLNNLTIVGMLYGLIVNVLAFGIVLYHMFNVNKPIESKSKKEIKSKEENNNEKN